MVLQPAAQPPPVKFHIAPMQCYTNRHLRDLLGRLCPAAVLWTEMEKTSDLATEAARHRRLWHRQTERPVVLQLGGDDPAQLAAAVRHAAPYGYSEVNLNCGCPSVEAGGADFGAALMRRPDATRRMLEAMAAAAGGVPVSLKCRVGTHERLAGNDCLTLTLTLILALIPTVTRTQAVAVTLTLPLTPTRTRTGDAAPPVDEYEPLAEFLHAVSRSGAVQHVAVHARAAVLSGLSPAHNRRVPPLRPELVARLALDFPQLRVTLNGGLEGLPALRGAAATPALDGLMCGRWALRRPLDLWLVQQEAWCDRGAVHVGTARATGAAGAASRAEAVRGYGRQAAAEVARGEAAVPEALAPLVLVGLALTLTLTLTLTLSLTLTLTLTRWRSSCAMSGTRWRRRARRRRASTRTRCASCSRPCARRPRPSLAAACARPATATATTGRRRFARCASSSSNGWAPRCAISWCGIVARRSCR